MRLQEGGGQEDVGKETVETAEKEGKQETVDTPLTSPSDDVIVQVWWNCFDDARHAFNVSDLDLTLSTQQHPIMKFYYLSRSNVKF